MFIPKKIFYVVGIGVLLALGVFIGSSRGNENTSPSAAQSAAVGNASRTEQTNTTPSFVSPSEEGERVRVVRVIDGDTIDVEIAGKVERVRYIGIDTPETVDPRKSVQCFGVEASKKNKELVEGKMVRLEKDITNRDKYHRLLRYIWLGDTLINQELVEQGFATSYSYPPDIKYQDRIVAAEKKARENKLGLWTACASETAPATTITPPATQASTDKRRRNEHLVRASTIPSFYRMME